MHTLKPMKKLQHQKGFSLLESLIAVLITALGVLGIIGMQMRTLTDTQTAVRRGQAIRLIEDMSERLHLNPSGLLVMNDYLSTYEERAEDFDSAANCTSSACSTNQLAIFDLKQWKTSIEETLPAGQASIFQAPGETDTNNLRHLGIMIAWRENEKQDTKQDDIDASKLRNVTNGSFRSGTDQDNACPDGFTCHLQYISVSLRCAPYKINNAPYCA